MTTVVTPTVDLRVMTRPRRAQIDGFGLDHVLYAGRDLDSLRSAFERHGMPSEYGGVHGNGVTHNAVVGFDDGSYVELLALVDVAERSPRRDALLRADVGPCGWALETDDARAAARRFEDRGVPVEGPVTLGRERPDGVRTEWDLVYLGEGEPGAHLPFLIEDRTARTRRIDSTAGVAGTALCGVDTVVVGVPDLDAAVGTFRRAFALSDPVRAPSSAALEGELAVFPGTPLALAAPTSDGRLADRVRRFGPLVCAFLVGADDFETAAERRDVDATEAWPDGRAVGWFAPADGNDGRVGIVDR